MSNEIVLHIEPTPENPRNSEGAFATLADGRIMFAYTRFTGGGGDHSTADIAVIYSDDGGKTWSEPEVLIPNYGGMNIMSVSLLRLQDGRLAMFYILKNSETDTRPVMHISDDEGTTWGDPKQTLDLPGYFVLNNDRVVQLSSGRLIIPVAFHRTRHRETQDEEYRMNSRGIAMWFHSDDLGQTWHEAEDWWGITVHSRSGFQEPGVVELGDGRLFAYMRTDTGCQWTTRSTDAGVHWDPPAQSQFISPNAPLCVKRIPGTDTLLAVWNDRSGRFPLPANSSKQGDRTPLACAVGDARTAAGWKNHMILDDEPGRGFAYTAIHFVEGDEPAALFAYCAGSYEKGSMLAALRIRRVTLNEITG